MWWEDFIVMKEFAKFFNFFSLFCMDLGTSWLFMKKPFLVSEKGRQSISKCLPDCKEHLCGDRHWHTWSWG
jgi:hypothetical protein